MELPLEIVREIFDFANIRCICDKKLTKSMDNQKVICIFTYVLTIALSKLVYSSNKKLYYKTNYIYNRCRLKILWNLNQIQLPPDNVLECLSKLIEKNINPCKKLRKLTPSQAEDVDIFNKISAKNIGILV